VAQILRVAKRIAVNGVGAEKRGDVISGSSPYYTYLTVLPTQAPGEFFVDE
jgi:hypothetical protein